jgi:hypothetical protein
MDNNNNARGGRVRTVDYGGGTPSLRSSLGSLMRVYVHTEHTLAPPPAASGYSAHPFWSGHMRNLSHTRTQWDCCWRSPINVEGVFKYDALAEVSAAARRARTNWLGVLADSDVLFQCTAQELRARFRRFGMPLVVSGERQWFPLPKQYPDPFGPRSGSWKAKFVLRHKYFFYPNSGLIMASSTGLEDLVRALHASPSFPCCSFEGDTKGFALDPCSSCRPPRRFPVPVRCAVDDQTCLQTVLSSRHAPAHAVDVNASLFLSLSELTPNDLSLKDGRLAYRATGEVPCVLHSNGHKAVLAALEPLLRNATAWALTPAATRARERRDHARGLETWQFGAWRRFALRTSA